MNISIVTDSTCDLPKNIVDRLGITVIPCYINLDGKSFLDGVELTREEFYQRLPVSHPHPTTSAPGTGTFLEVYNRLADEGSQGIISIHVSQSLSNVNNVATLAARGFERIPVKVVDSGQLTLGVGLLVEAAAEMAQQGLLLDDIEHKLLELRRRTYSFARLSTLEYLRRSGRLSHLQQGLASILDIKPIMRMNDGVAHMEMVRTRRRADERVVELAKGLVNIEKIGFVHANAEADVRLLMDQIQPFLPEGVTGYISDVTPVIGAHVGPGAICVSMVAGSQVEEHPSTMEKIVNKLRSI